MSRLRQADRPAIPQKELRDLRPDVAHREAVGERVLGSGRIVGEAGDQAVGDGRDDCRTGGRADADRRLLDERPVNGAEDALVAEVLVASSPLAWRIAIGRTCRSRRGAVDGAGPGGRPARRTPVETVTTLRRKSDREPARTAMMVMPVNPGLDPDGRPAPLGAAALIISVT
jgi:hypothetical protein